MLRSYQFQAISAVEECFANNKSCLVQLPTGTGKTRIMVEIIKHQDKKCLVIVHRDEILEQIKDTLIEQKICVGILSGTNQNYSDQKCCVASVQYINLHPELLNQFNFLAIDEAHHAVASTYQRLIKHFKEKGANIVGFTATTQRLDEIGLVNAFEELAFSQPIKWFIDNGFLVPAEAFKIECDIDTSKLQISKQTNEFILNDKLFAVLNASNWLNKCTETFLEHAKELKTIAFCASIEHSKQLVEKLKENGIKAEHLDYNVKQTDRKSILEKFKNGEIQVLSNVSILTEGFDLPEIQCVLFCRPTNSQLFYIQAIGRALRIHESKKKAIILDFTDKEHTLFQLADLSGESEMEQRLKNELLRNQIPTFDNSFFNEIFLSLSQRRHILHFLGKNIYKQMYELLTHPTLAWAGLADNAILEVSENSSILILNNKHLPNLKNSGLKTRLSLYNIPNLYTILNINTANEIIKVLGCSSADDSIEIASEYALSFATKIADASKRWRNDPPTKLQLERLSEFGLNVEKLAGANKGQCSCIISYVKMCKIIGLDYV